MLDLETLKQRAQLASTKSEYMERTMTLTWSDVLDIVSEIEDLQHELNTAEEDVGHEQHRVDALELQVSDLEDDLEDLRQQNRELVDSSKCRECNTDLARDLCGDCYRTGGR